MAHAQGGLANLSQFAAALGLSQPTVARYVDILEQSFLLRRLPSYFRRIDSLDELDSHPIRGASWETFVFENLLRCKAVAYPQWAEKLYAKYGSNLCPVFVSSYEF